MENDSLIRNIESEKLNIIIYDTLIHIKPKQSIEFEELKSEFQKIKSEILKEQKPLYFVEFNFDKDLVLDSSIVDNFNFSKCNINSIHLKNHLNFTHTFQECNIKKVSARSCYIHNEISFHNSIIEKADFSFAEFDKTADFSKAKFKQEAIFHNTIFKGLAKFSGAIFTKTIFLEAKFENIANFISTNFSSYTFFKDTKFQARAYFSISNFRNNAYFDNTTFSDYADFHEAEFEAVACFYGVNFEKSMNFSSVLFKDFNKANFINLNIENINLENINSAVEENYEDESYKKEREKIDNNSEENEKEKKIKELDLKYKIRWANNFRDSFRVIKHSLIETNNNLEASNFHKLELYAKEIELKNKITKEKNIKDRVERWQLGIYRNTSEHHTNLIRISSITISVIFLFGLLVFMFNLVENKISTIIIPFVNLNSEFQNKYLEANISQANKSEILNLVRQINDKIESKNSNFNLEFKDKQLEVNITEANRSEIINLIISLNPEFNATKNPNLSENLSISELNEYKKFIVENKDNLYKKLDDKDKFKQAICADSLLDITIKCISFIYAIILGLCLFSLQKTARRNSVVPS